VLSPYRPPAAAIVDQCTEKPDLIAIAQKLRAGKAEFGDLVSSTSVVVAL